MFSTCKEVKNNKCSSGWFPSAKHNVMDLSQTAPPTTDTVADESRGAALMSACTLSPSQTLCWLAAMHPCIYPATPDTVSQASGVCLCVM